ncbi:MAG TPA: HAD family hydrolase [Bacilli bacterium]|nr:HAD family hydrolase [Bacilli bacterium]
MLNKFKLVVFDLDGTLVDSDLALVKVGIEIARHYRQREGANIDDYLYLNGPPLNESLAILFPHDDIELTRQKYYDLAGTTIDDVSIFKSTLLVLESLLAAGVTLALFTSRHRRAMELILDKYDLNKYFSEIIAGNDGFAPKPSGEALTHIMERLNFSGKETLYVGDNWRDVGVARDAGTRIAFIKSHRRKPDETLVVDYELKDIKDVLEVVLNE